MFPEKIASPKMSNCSLLSSSLDLFSSVAHIWSKSFRSVPSAYENFNCKTCGVQSLNINTIWIKEQKIICDKGYSELITVLQNSATTYEATCPTCHQACLVNKVYNHHLFVEQKIKKSPDSPLISCKLQDFELNSKPEFFHNGIIYR